MPAGITSLERPLWRFRHFAQTMGYVCSTLEPVVGGAIFLMLERQEVAAKNRPRTAASSPLADRCGQETASERTHVRLIKSPSTRTEQDQVQRRPNSRAS